MNVLEDSAKVLSQASMNNHDDSARASSRANMDDFDKSARVRSQASMNDLDDSAFLALDLAAPMKSAIASFFHDFFVRFEASSTAHQIATVNTQRCRVAETTSRP